MFQFPQIRGKRLKTAYTGVVRIYMGFKLKQFKKFLILFPIKNISFVNMVFYFQLCFWGFEKLWFLIVQI